MQRGSEAEQQAAEQRQPQRDGQHVPVQSGVERESLLSIGEQPREHTDAGDGDEDAERAAERRQQQALGQQLTHQAEPSGADAEPHRHLAPAAAGPREQQIRRIRARDRQDQADHRQQHVERLRVLPPQGVESTRAFSRRSTGRLARSRSFVAVEATH